ncbi:MAG: ComF family protein [Moraxellaceae bacterium]|nr:ComF family protein [Moraxellaceae bacterium]
MMIPQVTQRLGSILASFTHHRQLLISQIVDHCRGNQCLLCADTSVNECLCPPCSADLAWLSETCHRCALPHEGDDICHYCDDDFGPDHTLAVFAYQFPVNALMAEFKYRALMAVTDLFAARLNDLALSSSLPDFIVAVPMHHQRLRQRGYNPALLLAKQVAKRLHVPLLTNALVRQHDGQQQKSLSAEQRLINLQNAFAWQGPSLQGRHIAIIDDVMTTGATAQVISKLLRQAGAVSVSAWVIARTLPS